MRVITIFLLLVFVLCSPSLDAQINWQPTNGPEGGATWYIRNNDQYAFYPDLYHLFRTSNGVDWEQLPFGNLWPIATYSNTVAAVKGIGFNYSNPDPHFVVSHDNGSSWTEGTFPPGMPHGFSDMAACSHGIYVPAPNQGLVYRTQDDGLTWDPIVAPGFYGYDIWSSSDQLFYLCSGKLWRLNTDNEDWTSVTPTQINQENINSVIVVGTHLLVSSEHFLWSSADSGLTWIKKAIPNHNGTDDFVAVGNRVYKIAGTTGLMYTDNYGTTWTEAPIPDDFDLLNAGTAGGKFLGASYNKGVAYYDETTQQLVPTNNGINSAAVYYMDQSDNEIWAACGNGIFAYNLDSAKWVDKAILPIPRHYYEQVEVSDAGKVAAKEWLTDKLLLSLDNGVSWDTIYPSTQGGLGGFGVEKIVWVGERLLLVTDWGGGLQSYDYGVTWEEGAMLPNTIVPFNGQYYGLNSLGLYLSTDGAVTWNEIQGPDCNSFYSLRATEHRLFLLCNDGFSQNTLYSTEDGIIWKNANIGIPDFYINSSNNDLYKGNIWEHNGVFYLYEPVVGFFISSDTCKTWLPVERTSYRKLLLSDSTMYAGGFGDGVNKAQLPQNYGALTSGTVYKDDNNNGSMDPGEIPLPHIKVTLLEPGAWYPYWFSTTESDGHFAIGLTQGATDTLKPAILSDYVDHINPPYYVVNGNSDNRNFGIHFVGNITDASVTGRFHGRPRPGFDLNATLLYQNKGTIPTNGVVSAKLDPNFLFLSADPPPTQILGDSLVWSFMDMPILEQRHIHIRGNLSSSAPLGSLAKLKGYVHTMLPDSMLADNHFVVCDTIVGSFDPNEKRVEPSQGLTAAEIVAGKELFYTVQFQNTGTYEAETVRIMDKLDTALNLTTLRYVASSHPVTNFRVLPGGLLEVVFDHIALPDVHSDEAGSHGFVTFAIQRKKAFSSYDKVENKAAIYFDFNEPIITNTVKTGVYTPVVSSDEPQSGTQALRQLEITPDPANDVFTVKPMGMVDGKGELLLINTVGQICYQQTINDCSTPVTVQSDQLESGMYIVFVRGEKRAYTGKVVIQH